MKILLPLFPSFACFGPILMVLFSSSDVLWIRLVGYAGAFMTSGAFFVLLALCQRQAVELAALKKE
jgi:hypothetical protein